MFKEFKSFEPLNKNISPIPHFWGGQFLWKSFFLLAYLMKKSPKGVHRPASKPFCYIQNRLSNIKCLVSTFLGDRFLGKEDGFRTCKPSSKELWDRICLCIKRITCYLERSIQSASRRVADTSSGLPISLVRLFSVSIQAFHQCCGTGTGTVGTVTFWLVEPEPEP